MPATWAFSDPPGRHRPCVLRSGCGVGGRAAHGAAVHYPPFEPCSHAPVQVASATPPSVRPCPRLILRSTMRGALVSDARAEVRRGSASVPAPVRDARVRLLLVE